MHGRTRPHLCVALLSEQDVAAIEVAVNNALGVYVAHSPRYLQGIPVDSSISH